jgi:hypothetical protein
MHVYLFSLDFFQNLICSGESVGKHSLIGLFFNSGQAFKYEKNALIRNARNAEWTIVLLATTGAVLFPVWKVCHYGGNGGAKLGILKGKIDSN